jgi:hypothetical protein
MNQTVAKNYNA